MDPKIIEAKNKVLEAAQKIGHDVKEAFTKAPAPIPPIGPAVKQPTDKPSGIAQAAQRSGDEAAAKAKQAAADLAAKAKGPFTKP